MMVSADQPRQEVHFLRPQMMGMVPRKIVLSAMGMLNLICIFTKFKDQVVLKALFLRIFTVAFDRLCYVRLGLVRENDCTEVKKIGPVW